MTRRTDITGVLLVGGRSRRMGRDKAFLEVGGMPLYERVLQALEEAFAVVMLVGDRWERFAGCRVPVYDDIYPGSTLGGLYTGLYRAATDLVFVSPCDIPFPNTALIGYISFLAEGHDVVVPLSADGLEPLFAVYRKTCLPHMKEQLERGNFRIRDFFPATRVRYVGETEIARFDSPGRSFVNLNTPEEFAGIAQRL